MPKRKAYSVCEKLRLVTRIRNGETQCKVSREMCIPESTLRGWIKDEVKLRKFAHTVQEDDGLQQKKIRFTYDGTLLDTVAANSVNKRLAIQHSTVLDTTDLNSANKQLAIQHSTVLNTVDLNSANKQLTDDAMCEREAHDIVDTVVQEEATPPPPSAAEAVTALEIGLRWIKARHSVDLIKVMQMSSLLNLAKADCVGLCTSTPHACPNDNPKQKKVTDFL